MAEHRLLIIDDDAGTCETLSDIFQEKGYSVTTVSTGRDAVDKAEQIAFDVALIDIKLPDTDGTTLLREFRENYPEMVCITITGHASLQNAVNALKEGARGYFVKPLVIEEVLLRVAEILDKQHLQRELRESAERLRGYSEELEHKVRERTIELENANKKLQELDHLKSIFIASMSHELRTPLNSIIGFTGVILKGMAGEINDDQKDLLQRVYNSANHLLALISDVIDIAKVESGNIQPYIEEFQLLEIIKEAISSLKSQTNDIGLAIEINIPHTLKIKTDKRRLLQCILNYLTNAIKFNERGHIMITANEINGMVKITVQDTGIGIKREDIPKLFNSFVRLNPNRTIPGTGLGLYLTKKLAVEVLGGSVAVESRYRKGSIFILKIPKGL